MKAFLINLDRNKDRLKEASRQLTELGIPYERFAAVDGRALTPADRRKHVSGFHARMARLDRLTPGEVGCSLSHLFVYKRMIDENIPAALIFEDDILLSPRFNEALSIVEASINPARPQVYLFTGDIHADISSGEDYRIRAVRTALWADAYVVTLEAARTLFRVNYPVIVMNDWWGRWRRRGLIELYRIIPTCSPQRQSEFQSDVTPTKTPHPKGIKWVFWKLIRIPCSIIDSLWWILFRR